MSKILFIKNKTREHPGSLRSILEKRGVKYDIIDLDKGALLPDPEKYDCLIVLGGPDSANDKTNKMISEVKYVKEWLETGKPYFGICLGLQVMVVAAGGHSEVNPVQEHGFFDHNDEAFTVKIVTGDPLFKGVDKEFKVFQLHGETVSLTDSMTVLGSGEHCVNQIIKLNDNQYGVQFHLELDQDMMSLWAEEDSSLIEIGTSKIVNQFSDIFEEYTRTGNTLFNNFLNIAEI